MKQIKHNKRKERINKHKGSILAFTLMILGIVLVSALSMALVSMRERRASIGAGRSDIAYHNADAGIEKTLNEIIKNSAGTDAVSTITAKLGTDAFCNATSGLIEYDDFNGTVFNVKLISNTTPISCNSSDPTHTVSIITAIKSTGTSGQYQRAVTAPVIKVDFLQVAAGENHSLALDSSGNVWAWGDNSNGQLGQGIDPDDNKSYPVKVKDSSGSGFLSNIAYISAAGDYSLAVDNNGYVWAWGDNSNGQLGTISGSDLTLPANVRTESPAGDLQVDMSGLVDIKACGDFSLALSGNKEIWSWGYRGSGNTGQLGRAGLTSDYYKAGKVEYSGGDLLGKYIACGEHSGFALDDAGRVWVWGDKCVDGSTGGSCGSSYNLTAVSSLDPALFPGPISKIAAGGNSALALKDDETVLAWGDNSNGQLGTGDTSFKSSPAAVSGLSNIAAMSMGKNSSVFINASGNVYAAGKKFYGVTGRACNASGEDNVPILISGFVANGNFGTDIFENHALIIGTGRKAYSWGENRKTVPGRTFYKLGIGPDPAGDVCRDNPVEILF